MEQTQCRKLTNKILYNIINKKQNVELQAGKAQKSGFSTEITKLPGDEGALLSR